MADEIALDEQPYEALAQLYDTNDPIANVVDRWLDLIEADPGAKAVRPRLIRPGAVWAISITIPGISEKWLLLWALDDTTPRVRYLGPDRLGL